jgi:hypothetical protein
MIYKISTDGTRVRTTPLGDEAGTVEFEKLRFGETLSVVYLKGEEAERRIAELIALDAIRFATVYGAGPQALARTGRPHAIPAAIVGACVAATAAVGFICAPDAQAPTYPLLRDVSSANVAAPSPASPSPYRPEPRTRPTTRDEERATLTPSPSPSVARPSTTPATKRPIATPPADIRISFYRDCTGHAQQCIDAGSLTMYAGNILAGHNYMGYQWLSRVPVGRMVRVISGPLAGTYEVYGHLTINRQGGTIPSFAGSPDLVLQSCEGSGTGFSLLRRVR